MNPAELRYAICKLLADKGLVGLVSPEPGEPLALTFDTPDDYLPGATRKYRISITEEG
jgi:hypothetical protein